MSNKMAGETEVGNFWACIMDPSGFHFSVQRNTSIIAEHLPERELTRERFYQIISDLEKELCEVEHLDDPKTDDGSGALKHITAPVATIVHMP